MEEYLERKFSQNPPAASPTMQEHYAPVEEKVRKCMASKWETLVLPPAELHKIVLRLPKRKAPGLDGISTAALRQLPKRAMVAMNKVFNGILRTGHFPEAWKRDKINTILKPEKDPRNPSNLRSITLLSHVAKTFERALLTRLNLFLSPRKEQYGFRTGRSTTLQLLRADNETCRLNYSGQEAEWKSCKPLATYDSPGGPCDTTEPSREGQTPARTHL
ncbi:Probable RNA-directed DNA polymerase from transposon X-element [Eumeta japonica]|uniref:Probable RNA-directed DNA polymerase from transposon X-element n=1 Tax=Eumeta variegata TaxID=151549 RepID=A0A4C1S9H5_EUMVA|nr:Probable RNA-directed DNA polymerase from transposon X-element [Eumeta japonica]